MGIQMDSLLSSGIASPTGRSMLKNGQKFQGNHKEALENYQNQCAIAFGLRVREEKLGFFLEK